MTTIPMHIRAVDWALIKGFYISVNDYCCEPDEWDVQQSNDRDEILDAINGTEIPNVYIYEKLNQSNDDRDPAYRHITTFSVIDEGNPSETINDYTCGPNSNEFDKWFSEACGEY